MSDMTDPKWRKQRPVFSGVLMYFPDALREVAHCSFMGNEQHHPGEPLHWDRSKSTDEADACVRHLMESGTVDTDGVRHSAKAAWRALALLQKEIEAEEAKAQPVFKLSDFRLDPECEKNRMFYFGPVTCDPIAWEDAEGDPNFWGV
jgi:hypothetical protein